MFVELSRTDLSKKAEVKVISELLNKSGGGGSSASDFRLVSSLVKPPCMLLWLAETTCALRMCWLHGSWGMSRSTLMKRPWSSWVCIRHPAHFIVSTASGCLAGEPRLPAVSFLCHEGKTRSFRLSKTTVCHSDRVGLPPSLWGSPFWVVHSSPASVSL